MTTSPSPTWMRLAAEAIGRTPVDAPEGPLIGRVRAEYREMPGLCLTVPQACRLWQIDATTCTRILDVLVVERFLRRTPSGTFIAAALTHQSVRFELE